MESGGAAEIHRASTGHRWEDLVTPTRASASPIKHHFYKPSTRRVKSMDSWSGVYLKHFSRGCTLFLPSPAVLLTPVKFSDFHRVKEQLPTIWQKEPREKREQQLFQLFSTDTCFSSYCLITLLKDVEPTWPDSPCCCVHGIQRCIQWI